MRHKHRFVATPLTGQNMATGKESLFGWQVRCEVCYKQIKEGNVIEEIKASSWREVVPKGMLVNIVFGSGV